MGYRLNNVYKWKVSIDKAPSVTDHLGYMAIGQTGNIYFGTLDGCLICIGDNLDLPIHRAMSFNQFQRNSMRR